MRTIGIIDTTLQEAQQCLWDGQMQVEDIAPIIKTIDNAGYLALQVWGGESFQLALQNSSRNPWEILEFIKQEAKNTPLQATIHGQFLVGPIRYPQQVVEKFLEKSLDYGITIFRVLDPLNDWKQLLHPLQAVKKLGAHAQGAVICHHRSNSEQEYANLLHIVERIVEAGADSLCLIDETGFLTPTNVGFLIAEIKKFKLPLNIHFHYNGATALAMCCLAAEAGADQFDTASLPLAFGPSLPPAETLVHCLNDGGFVTGIKTETLFEIASYWENVRRTKGFARGITTIYDIYALEHEVSGKLLREIEKKLAQQHSLPYLKNVLEEIRQIKKEIGYPPTSVPPISIMLTEQAIANVLNPPRYKVVIEEVKNYLRGWYGEPPEKIDEKLISTLLGSEGSPKLESPGSLPPPWEKQVQELSLSKASEKEEEILTRVLFPPMAAQLAAPSADNLPAGTSVNNQMPPGNSEKETSEIKEVKNTMRSSEIKEILTYLNGSGVTEFSLENGDFKLYIKRIPERERTAALPLPPQAAELTTTPAPGEETASPPSPPLQEEKKATMPSTGKKQLYPVVAPIVGRFYRSQAPGTPPFVEVGTRVTAGQTLCIVEAMKVMNEVTAEINGVVVEILVENGKPVEYGQTLMLLAPEEVA